MKASVYSTTLRGKLVWVAAWTDPAGKRHRRYLDTRRAAESVAGDLMAKSARAGDVWLAMTSRQRSEIIDIHEEIVAAGTTLRAVWEAHQRAVPTATAKPLGDAVRECVASKKEMSRREPYVASLEYALERFARGREQALVASVTSADIETWLRGNCAKASSRATYQQRIATLFAWCVRAGHCTNNPCDRLGRVSLEQRAPVILSPAQVDAALAWVAGHSDFRAYLVLGLFAGIRPDELARLKWEAVDLARGLVTIDAATSKVRRRRIVPLAPRARALMSPKSDSGTCPTGPVWPGSAMTLRRRRRALAEALGIPWSADLLRHTCASYMMARDRDAGKVAAALGNSPSVLLTRYTELVGPEDAERFWAV